MIRNVGDIDRRIRIGVGALIMMVGAMNSDIFGLVGALPLISGLYAYCPVYKAMKIDTMDQNKPKDKFKR